MLEDIADSAAFISKSTRSVSLADYQSDRMLRSAIERNLEIIGEALLRLERIDHATAARISHYRQIIGFRNRLAHGYDAIDQTLVWEIIRVFLPQLESDIASISREDAR